MLAPTSVLLQNEIFTVLIFSVKYLTQFNRVVTKTQIYSVKRNICRDSNT